MATLLTRKSTKGKMLYTVQFVLGGRRPCVPLGPVTKAQALQAKGYIESLAACQRSNTTMDGKTAAWLADVDDEFFAILVDRGLCEPRKSVEPETQPDLPKLGEFLTAYTARRTDVKPNTLTVWGHTRRCLVNYFGANRELADITVGEAEDWRRWLTRPAPQGQGLADNTARKRCAFAKQFFADAVKRRLMAENPFGGMRGLSARENRARDFFVTRTITGRVLDACPDAQWQLLLALSRFGGLRCPSEHLGLRWPDIDWERGMIVVRSPKTEHHEGKDCRVIPLFPELRPYLEALWDEAPEGTEYVITRYRDTNANLRTQLLRIIAKAKVKPWPKLFQNLRASRATELAADYPGHVAAGWLGHSTAVATKHYWQVTDADFDRACALHQRCSSQRKQANRTAASGTAKAENPMTCKFLDY